MWSSCFNPLELCSVLTRPERGWLTFYKDMDDLKEKKKKKTKLKPQIFVYLLWKGRALQTDNYFFLIV